MGQVITRLLRRLLGREAKIDPLSSDHHDHSSEETTRSYSFFDRYWKILQAIIWIVRRLLGGGGAGKPPSDSTADVCSHQCCYTDVGIDTVNDQQVAGEVEAEEGGDDGDYEYLSPVVATAEGQPRLGTLGPYHGTQRILLVGEGDFSFSVSLAVAFGDASNMVATSLDSFEYLIENYKKVMVNILELTSRRCKVMHEVDATKMVNHPQLSSLKFDCIIYNFPHAGFSKRDEPRDAQIEQHQALVRGFMSNAKEMIDGDGQIHITHKCVGFFSEWNIEMLGSSEGLRVIEEVPFNFRDYPGYCAKLGYGGDKKFNCKPSKVYKFQLALPKKKKKV